MELSFLRRKSPYEPVSQLPPPSGNSSMPSRRRTALYSIRLLLVAVVSLSLLAYLFPPSFSPPLHESDLSDPSASEPPPPVDVDAHKVAASRPPPSSNNNVLSCTSPQKPVTSIDADGNKWTTPSLPLPVTHTLAQRIAAWRAAPRASHEAWTKFGSETCGRPSVVQNINQLHQRNNIEKWNEVDEAKVHAVREELIGVLLHAEKSGGLKVNQSWTERGIIFTAGNADTFERVIVTLRILREYGTELPAEVFHFPGEQPTSAQEFEYNKLRAVAREVQGLDKDQHDNRRKSFHIKGAALLQSSFREFLYLDSDSIPTKDVTPLFDAPAYRSLGAMFWPDFWKDSADNAIWSILGVQCRDEWTQEAGQVLLDKSKHLDILHLVNHMLSVAQYEFFFTLSDGDKDLFRYAFLALRKRWAVPGRTLASASWTDDNAVSTHRFCGHTMMQFDADGRPAFVHQNLIKMLMGRFTNGTTWGRTHQLHFPSIPGSSLSTPTSADHLANIDSAGSGICPSSSLAVLARALAESGLRPFFHEAHRGSYYTLCVDSEYKQPELGVDLDGKERELNEVEKLLEVEGVRTVWMEMSLWEDDEDLKEFESRFYAAKGVANGSGFR